MTAIAGIRAARSFHQSDTLPVSLEQICEMHSIGIYLTALDDVAAYYVETNGRRMIIVNQSAPRSRRRFSIAHEIGHVVLRHGAIRLMLEKTPNGRPAWQEIQANAFAAELLMPKLALTKHGVLTPRQIARMCNVSLEAAEIRAKQFGWM